MKQKEYSYLTEEELNKFIKEIEEGECLKAPSYLKDEILNRVLEFGMPKEEIGETPHLPKNQQKEKRILWLYSLRIGVAAAAAMLLLCFVPIQEVPQLTWTKTNIASTLTKSMNEKSREWCSMLTNVSDRVLLLETHSSGKE